MTRPPRGLPPSSVPLFLVLGWDDNADVEGMAWALDLAARHVNPDGSPLSMSFYCASCQVSVAGAAWREAHDRGHEIGVHTHSHAEVLKQCGDFNRWRREIRQCAWHLSRLGIRRTALTGFRTPYLAHSSATLSAVRAAGLVYDCSLEEGFEDTTGTNYRWPYTLDGGSPGNGFLARRGAKRSAGVQPGLWELPVYAVIAPPDPLCERYGVPIGLRQRLAERFKGFNPMRGHITGFDYNLWVLCVMTPEEVNATLSYTLEQRLAGNRAPFFLGLHSDLYGRCHPERRRAVEAFLERALSHAPVRVVSAQKALEWLRHPRSLQDIGQSARPPLRGPDSLGA